MITHWQSLQPAYDALMKEQAQIEAMLEKLAQEARNCEQAIATARKSAKKGHSGAIMEQGVRLLRIHHQQDRLRNYQSHLSRRASALDTAFKNLNGLYPGHRTDMEKNHATLAQRKSLYLEQFRALPLSTEHADPAAWSLDASKVTLPELRLHINRSLPIACKPCGETHTPDPLVIGRRTYKSVRLKYADSIGGAVANRYIIYWKYDRRKPEELEPYTTLHVMLPIGFGMTDSAGYLHQSVANMASIEPDPKQRALRFNAAYRDYAKAWKKTHAPVPMNNPFEKFKKLSEVFDPTFNAFFLEDGGKDDYERFKKYGRLTAGSFDPDAMHGFMVYPGDNGPFITKDLFELIKTAAPVYPGSEGLGIAVKTMIPEDAVSGAVLLHCTLPKWRQRLEEKLAQLKVLIHGSRLIKQPHQAKLRNVNDMQTVAELYLNFPYPFQTEANIADKENLIAALEQLRAGISLRLDYPSMDRAIVQGFAAYLDMLDRCALELWELLDSAALRAELKRYLDHVSKAVKAGEKVFGRDPQGQPIAYPDPDMRREDRWENIFVTLAECYAAMTASPLTQDKAWEDVEGMFALIAASPHADKFMAEWLEAIKKSEAGEPSLAPPNSGQDSMLKELLELKPDPDAKPKESLLSDTLLAYLDWLADLYTDEAKAALLSVVPTPGPPCIMEVAINSYQNRLIKRMQLLADDEKKFKVYHIRLTLTVMHVFGMFGGDKKDRVANYRFIYLSFTLAQGPDPYANARTAKSGLIEFFKRWDFPDDRHTAPAYDKLLT